METINLQLIPYKNNNGEIKKYHIVNQNNSLPLFDICNVFSQFGRQTDSDHKTTNIMTQHRLNICFSCEQIGQKNKPYVELINIIQNIENYFSSFNELKNMKIISNIIDRKEYGVVIRFHLKTYKNKTTTPLININKNKEYIVEWVQFDKNKHFDFKFHPDCLWIDEKNNKFGISLAIDKVFQIIS